MTGYNFTQANYVWISKELKVIQYMLVFNILTKLSMNKIKEWIFIKDFILILSQL